MGRNPIEQGAQAVGNAIEDTRRLGVPRDVVLDHFLYDEESGGFRGAMNAAENACQDGEIGEEEKGEYVMGWVITLAEAMQNRL